MKKGESSTNGADKTEYPYFLKKESQLIPNSIYKN